MSVPTEGPWDHGLYLRRNGTAESVYAVDGALRPTSVKAAMDLQSAAIAQVRTGALLVSAWDGPIVVQAGEPADETALWVDNDGIVRQYVGGADSNAPTNYARQTATHATTGFTASISTNLRMDNGRVTATTGTGSGARIAITDMVYAATVTPGDTLTVAADIGGGGTGHGSSYGLRIVWHDAAGAVVASKTSTYAALSTSGTRRSIADTVPAGIAYAALNMVCINPAVTIVDIWLSRISATTDGSTDYISGDHPGYTWDGQPGLSVSVPDYSGPWKEVSRVADLKQRKESDNTGPAPALASATRTDVMRRRRGGLIGVGDKQVVAVRLDHGVQEAHDKGVLAALAGLGIPYHLCMCPVPDSSVVAEAPVPWDIVREAAATGGAEIGNHSRTHAMDPLDYRAEIVDGLTELQALVPDQAIEVWTQPGLSESGTMYDGYNMARTPDTLYGTDAGRLIMSHHGAVWGAMTGQFWTPLDGHPHHGMAAYFTDSRRPYQVQNHITAGRGQVPAMGGVVAFHPAWLDRGGSFQTAAEVIEWLTWLAAERDAGRVELLTHAGMAVASSHDVTHPALQAKSGTITAGGSMDLAPTGGSLASLNRAPFGAAWQAIATLTATAAGDVTLTAAIGSTTSTVMTTVTGGQQVTLRRHLLLPLDAATSPTVALTATGGATVTDLRLQAV